MIRPCILCERDVRLETFGSRRAQAGEVVTLAKGFKIGYGRKWCPLCHVCFSMLHQNLVSEESKKEISQKLLAYDGRTALSRESWTVMARVHGMTWRQLKKATSRALRKQHVANKRRQDSHVIRVPMDPLVAEYLAAIVPGMLLGLSAYFNWVKGEAA